MDAIPIEVGLYTRAANSNLNSNWLELNHFCGTQTPQIKFFELELEFELKKKRSSSSSLIECFKFIDSNLSKRTLLLMFCYGLNNCNFAILVPILYHFAFHFALSH